MSPAAGGKAPHPTAEPQQARNIHYPRTNETRPMTQGILPCMWGLAAPQGVPPERSVWAPLPCSIQHPNTDGPSTNTDLLEGEFPPSLKNIYEKIKAREFECPELVQQNPNGNTRCFPHIHPETASTCDPQTRVRYQQGMFCDSSWFQSLRKQRQGPARLLLEGGAWS